jgi:putative ABC transport system ATP-binding protein
VSSVGPSARDVLRDTIEGQRRDVVLGSVLSAAHPAAEVLVPVRIGVVGDRAVARGDTGGLVLWIVVPACAHLVFAGPGA